MNPKLVDRGSSSNSVLLVQETTESHFIKLWHFHPEFELVYIVESNGTRFIGNNIERFSTEALVLIGNNLPHMWINDEEYFKGDSDLKASSISIHFNKENLGINFSKIPELRKVAKLLDHAQKGIVFSEGTSKKLKNEIIALNELKPDTKYIAFLELLRKLSNERNVRLLNSADYVNPSKTQNDKLSVIFDFIYNNFKTEISLQDIADHIKMNKAALCRFFKNRTNETLAKYIQRIRIEYACQQLMVKDDKVIDICFESGFNNLSHFNKVFKELMNVSPREYKKMLKD